MVAGIRFRRVARIVALLAVGLVAFGSAFANAPLLFAQTGGGEWAEMMTEETGGCPEGVSCAPGPNGSCAPFCKIRYGNYFYRNHPAYYGERQRCDYQWCQWQGSALHLRALCYYWCTDLGSKKQ
jgi:hypothetical protein